MTGQDHSIVGPELAPELAFADQCSDYLPASKLYASPDSSLRGAILNFAFSTLACTPLVPQ